MSTDLDGELNDAEVKRRLPSLGKGTFELSFQNLERSEGDQGIFDIFEFEVVSASPDAQVQAGDEAKIMIKRNETGWKKEKRDADVVAILEALNGEPIDDRTDFIKNLRANPKSAAGTKIKARVEGKPTKTPGRERFEYSFSAVKG